MGVLDVILMAIPIVLGVGFIWTRVSRLMTLLKEISDVLLTVANSLGDKQLTVEEIDKIKKEALEVAAAAKALVSK